jgi:prolyl oligopeptidase
MIPQPPETRRVDASERLHEIHISAPFRWLEEPTTEVENWQELQDTHARAWLDAHADSEHLRDVVDAVVRSTRPVDLEIMAAGDRVFTLRRQPPRPLPFLAVVRQGEERAEPLPIDEEATIDWFVPSPDGRFVAVSLSEGGGESGVLHVIDLDRASTVGEPIPRATEATAGGDLLWSESETAFLYTRYGKNDPSPSLFYHRLKDDWRNDVEVRPDDEWTGPASVRLHGVAERAIAEVTLHRRGDKTLWRLDDEKGHLVVGPDAGVTEVAVAPDDAIYVRIRSDDTDIIARLDRGNLSPVVTDVALVARMTGSSAATMVATSDRLFAAVQEGIGSRIQAFDREGQQCESPTAPTATAVSQLSTAGDDLLFRESSFVTHPRWRRFDPARGETRDVDLASQDDSDLPAASVRRETAIADDGTEIPVTVILPESTSQPPCVVYGYGAYGRSLGPSLTVTQQICLRFGVAFAIAHVRGGGELGPQWHEQGRRANKVTSVTDFVAAIRRLRHCGLLDAERIAVRGGSFGAVLVTSAMTRIPDQIRAVVAVSGPYDLPRFEREPNGQFNVDEFGTIENEEECRALVDLSPYHQAEQVREPPPVLLLHGQDDARVSIAHARKMLARLQTQDPEGTHLLRVSWATGHTKGTQLDEWAEQNVAVHGFLFYWLEVPLEE